MIVFRDARRGAGRVRPDPRSPSASSTACTPATGGHRRAQARGRCRRRSRGRRDLRPESARPARPGKCPTALISLKQKLDLLAENGRRRHPRARLRRRARLAAARGIHPQHPRGRAACQARAGRQRLPFRRPRRRRRRPCWRDSGASYGFDVHVIDDVKPDGERGCLRRGSASCSPTATSLPRPHCSATSRPCAASSCTVRPAAASSAFRRRTSRRNPRGSSPPTACTPGG